ncbi:unnamed protein product [Symbiodinium sp. CCMP2456]|nr:unnamed protein product [Symbiodinium sp. CCMP2456]
MLRSCMSMYVRMNTCRQCSWPQILGCSWPVLSALAMDVSVNHLSTRPHVWVVDGAVSDRFLDLVDKQLASSEGTVTSELRNGKSITSRSVEFGVDDVSRQLFETVAGFWGLLPEQSIESFVVSDICGEGQAPHVDHINLDDLPVHKLDFLDLTRQSSSPLNPRRVVPTISVVVYFNSVGGLHFPHSADKLGTIAAKRGRIVMFQNYVDTDRPHHDSMAAHCGIYLDSLPKRILVMGILANETPSFSQRRPGSTSPKPGLIYCPGTAQDPLRHDAPSYDYMRTAFRKSFREAQAAVSWHVLAHWALSSSWLGALSFSVPSRGQKQHLLPST